jgi:hypothetical protein
MSETCRMIMDVDPGIDDAMTIFYAVKHPGMELEAPRPSARPTPQSQRRTRCGFWGCWGAATFPWRKALRAGSFILTRFCLASWGSVIGRFGEGGAHFDHRVTEPVRLTG